MWPFLHIRVTLLGRLMAQREDHYVWIISSRISKKVKEGASFFFSFFFFETAKGDILMSDVCFSYDLFSPVSFESMIK